MWEWWGEGLRGVREDEGGEGRVCRSTEGGGLGCVQMRRLLISILVNNKLFTRSTHLCVHELLDHCWLKREEGTNLLGKKGVSKLNNKLFTSFISYACSSLVHTKINMSPPPSLSLHWAPFCLAPTLLGACWGQWILQEVFRLEIKQDGNFGEEHLCLIFSGKKRKKKKQGMI